MVRAVTLRWLCLGLALAACRDGGAAARSGRDAAPAVAPAPAARAAIDPGWARWLAAADAYVEPAASAPSPAVLAMRLGDGDELTDDERAALHAALADNRAALRALAEATRATPCHAAAAADLGSVARAGLRLSSLLHLLAARAALAGADADLDEAVVDVAAVLAAARSLAACRGGLLVTTVALGGERTGLDAARGLARIVAPGGEPARALAAALAAHEIPLEEVAAALEAEAALAGAALAAQAGEPRALAEAILRGARVRRALDEPLPEVTRVDLTAAPAPAAVEALAGLIARHPAAVAVDATRASIQDGLAGMADAVRRYGGDAPPLGHASDGRLVDLLEELGVAAVVLRDPESLRAPVPAAVERAFLAVDNPLGRHVAVEALAAAAAAVPHALDALRRNGEARADLLASVGP